MTNPRLKQKSKRVSLKQKYKVEKKVREHHKKLRRDAKKNPNKRQKLKKDPGIPNLWPFKEQMMDKIDENKRMEQEEKSRRKLEKKQQLEELRMKAEMDENLYEERIHELDEDSYIDSSRRSYFKEFKKVVKASDVILQVLDARDPLGTRCKDIEQQILREDPTKKIVLVLNKIDLVPRQNLEKWMKYLRNEFPTIAFKSSTQNSKNYGNTSLSKMSTMGLSQSGVPDCLGATALLSLLKNYARSRDVKLSITVGIIGIPNVGKSSLINSLKRAKAVNVGATPGITKSSQEIHLDKNIKLLDCPGIVFTSATSEAEAALRNAVALNMLSDFIKPVELILERSTLEQLMELYKIAEFENSIEFLTLVAQKRGKLKAKGIVDIDGAAKMVIQDWNTGKIPFLSDPPTNFERTLLETSVVNEWRKEFNIHEVEDIQVEDLQMLPSEENLKSVQYVSIAPSNVLKADGMYINDEESNNNDAQKSKKVIAQDSNNHQINQMKKQAVKKKSKAEKKRKRDMDEDEMEQSDEDSEDYNFGTDFWTG